MAVTKEKLVERLQAYQQEKERIIGAYNAIEALIRVTQQDLTEWDTPAPADHG